MGPVKKNTPESLLMYIYIRQAGLIVICIELERNVLSYIKLLRYSTRMSKYFGLVSSSVQNVIFYN
jgi:hypothetical protein